MSKENEQLLKNVKPQEVNSLVQTSQNDNPASGNRLQERLQRFEILEKDFPFTKVCEDASFWSYKTIPDVHDGFGDRTPACREHTLPRADSDSRIFSAIPGQTIIGPVLQVHVIQYLGINGFEIQIIISTTTVKSRGKNRYVEELHFNDADHNPTSSEWLLERSVAKESEPCSAKMEQSRIEETHATQFEMPTNPVHHSKGFDFCWRKDVE